MSRTSSAPSPTSTEPILGWRRWIVSSGTDGFRLRSWANPYVWQPMEPARANHRLPWWRRRHRDALVASPSCFCGLYAFKQRWAATAVERGPFVTAVGSVALWGRVIEHQRGYRGEYAYPQQLRLVGATLPGDGRLSMLCGACYETPCATAVADAWGKGDVPVLALCDECAATLPDKQRHTVTPLADLQQMLLDRYAVDVMA